MTNETKTIFDAPWELDEEEQVRNASGDLVAEGGVSVDDLRRVTHLPELYDALEDAAERVCKKCVAFWFPGQKFDFPQNFADFICPITKAGCFCENWLNLLKKVKDGK